MVSYVIYLFILPFISCIFSERSKFAFSQTHNTCFLAHYALPVTSKLYHLGDLDAASRSFGFRGEALASISDVALVEIVTKAYGKPNGYRKVIKVSTVTIFNKLLFSLLFISIWTAINFSMVFSYWDPSVCILELVIGKMWAQQVGRSSGHCIC